MSDKDSWHLQQRVTIGLIVALLAQAGGIVWWASQMESRVNDHDRRITTNEGLLQHINGGNEKVIDRLARLETQVQNGMASLDRIELSLRDISSRQRK